jgi:hypothetical protein
MSLGGANAVVCKQQRHFVSCVSVIKMESYFDESPLISSSMYEEMFNESQESFISRSLVDDIVSGIFTGKK